MWLVGVRSQPIGSHAKCDQCKSFFFCWLSFAVFCLSIFIIANMVFSKDFGFILRQFHQLSNCFQWSILFFNDVNPALKQCSLTDFICGVLLENHSFPHQIHLNDLNGTTFHKRPESSVSNAKQLNYSEFYPKKEKIEIHNICCLFDTPISNTVL